jgi:hypothetical protein
MPVSVVKYGPYFGSGAISFSQLRSNFAERGSGEMKASDLRRNTNLAEANPIVPDSTENEQISTGSNLSLSQFRNSIKRYVATQSGTDDNTSFPGEPGFRMGRYDLAGKGIDWSGGGYYGRDGQGGGVTGNLTKNVQKGILITGTCGSVRPGLAGAQMAPVVQVHNVRIDVSGSIFGYGGLGGTVENGNAEDGSTALNFGNVGNNCRLIVGSGARIYGGGGGGEKGKRGANGANGTCFNYYYYGAGSGCEWCGSCGGGERIGGCQGVTGCNCFIWCRNTQLANASCRGKNQYTKSGGTGGVGGNGGNGRGYNNQSSSLSGQPGAVGQPGNCSGYDGTITTPGTGLTGTRGGNGGDWGSSGEGTDAPGNPGRGGNAVARDGSNKYEIMPQSVINSNTIKGNIY